MQKSSPFILVDGSSYLYRAYHAMFKQDLRNSKKQPTGATRVVISMLRRLIKDYDPQLIAVVFDAKGKTFRDDIYKEYKANRPPMPDDLRAQIEPVHQIVKAMGIPLLMVEGVEADDVIGTLARQASAMKLETLISTGDKDMAQLVDEHVTLVNTMTDSLMNPEGVMEKFGVRADQIIDYLALMGDSSDNIPGVPKVGPKTAVKWLTQFGSLDAVIENADAIGGKVGENLRNNFDQARTSRQLATIKCDVELGNTPDTLILNTPDKESLKSLFAELEFESWLAEIVGNGHNGAASADSVSDKAAKSNNNYETILNDAQLALWLSTLKQADYFAFDTETTDLNYMNAEIVGVSFAVETGKAAYVPLMHDYIDAPQQLNREKVLGQLKPLLEDPQALKLGQNLKYDMSVLANHGIHLRGIQYDTMLESYVLDSTATRHDMDSLALKYLGHNTIHFEDIAGKGKKQITFNQVSIEEAAPYAAEDADITLRLHQHLWPKLSVEGDMCALYQNLEIPLISVLSRIERNGVLVDATMLAEQSKELEQSTQDIELKAHELAGEAFNMSSPKQIQAILFEKMELPVLKKTPKGQPSTAEAVLQELALDYPLPKLILEYRSLSKLKSTYTDKLPLQINKKSGRIHTSYHQAVASTGRLSSTEPNLQNIPIRSAEGRRIRQAFIAAPGNKIIAADYSQIELRIMAHLSKDEGLINAFHAGEDIHRATAAEVFGVDSAEVSQEQRRRAKAINFGLIYGMSAFGLGRQLGIGRKEAQEYVDLYFERYPGVKRYMDETREHAREQGYVSTLFGRRLYLPEINHSNAQLRQYAERTAINAPMQGTAADIIKKAMIAADKWINDSSMNIKMIMQVHDELVFDVAHTQVEDAIQHIKTAMTDVAQLDIPLVVDVGVGDNWDEAH